METGRQTFTPTVLESAQADSKPSRGLTYAAQTELSQHALTRCKGRGALWRHFWKYFNPTVSTSALRFQLYTWRPHLLIPLGWDFSVRIWRWQTFRAWVEGLLSSQQTNFLSLRTVTVNLPCQTRTEVHSLFFCVPMRKLVSSLPSPYYVRLLRFFSLHTSLPFCTNFTFPMKMLKTVTNYFWKTTMMVF